MIDFRNKDQEPDVYKRTVEFQKIASRGVDKAQADARQAGVPLVYSINGILHWELPDGSLTTVDPWGDAAGPKD